MAHGEDLDRLTGGSESLHIASYIMFTTVAVPSSMSPNFTSDA